MSAALEVDAVRDWVVSQPEYCDALDAVDRAGDRLADSRTQANRRRFDEALETLRRIEAKLTEQATARAKAVSR